ncbi:acetyl-CoA carboxylase biotin carboxylase subunit [Ruminococcus sp.]
MWKKVLIANRGEIAVRIIRACREAGLQCVTVYSTADKTALHAEIADESVCIGPPSVQDSYLNMNALISACQNTGAEALHPGFGFLSESAEFAQLCIDNGITFIGPSPASISMLGDKARAKETMKAAGVPVIPGSDGAVTSVEEAKKIAAEIGYPVLVKASAGGGGRGIRRIDREDQLEEQMSVAKEEAKLFFGNDEVYLEKLIVGPHHVEIQIIADQMGNTVALGERDCSMQRRNQKVLEESPSPLMTPELRKAMQEAAVRAAKACGYYNAGTIEFLVDDDRNFYFMEMNTRIQVEHPVTEWVTGVDLVQTQLLVAQGKPLPFTQDDIEVRGHAIECRINAENPEQGFRPSPGKIRSLHIPGGPGIRVDSAVYQGYTIPPYYDSMIAKLIVHAPTRSQAIMKMRWALAEFIVDGIDSNIDFQLRLIKNKDFETGTYDNTFLEKFLADSKNDKDNGK